MLIYNNFMEAKLRYGQVNFATSQLYVHVHGRKLKRASFGQKPFEMLSIVGLQVDLTPESKHCDQWPLLDCPRGHLRPWKVTISFQQQITFDKDKLVQWKQHMCSGQIDFFRSGHDLELRSNFQNDL